jgi:hypothetical protein
VNARGRYCGGNGAERVSKAMDAFFGPGCSWIVKWIDAEEQKAADKKKRSEYHGNGGRHRVIVGKVVNGA